MAWLYKKNGLGCKWLYERETTVLIRHFQQYFSYIVAEIFKVKETKYKQNDLTDKFIKYSCMKCTSQWAHVEQTNLNSNRDWLMIAHVCTVLTWCFCWKSLWLVIFHVVPLWMCVKLQQITSCILYRNVLKGSQL